MSTEEKLNTTNQSEILNFLIPDDFEPMRIDKALSYIISSENSDMELSRSRIRSLIDQGHICLNSSVCTSASKKLAGGDVVEIKIPPPEPCIPEAQDIPVDIIYEDSDLLVINKPAGLVVHPGAGNFNGTLVNALLHHCGDDLSGIGGVLRPGIVHRLDKDTSGLMVVAKSDKAHKGLSLQLEKRTLGRRYKALVLKIPVPPKGIINQPIGRHPSRRTKMTVGGRKTKEAKTLYHIEKSFGNACALVKCKLESGRTHQIRVHMEYIKHPLIGDPTYGPQPNALNSALKKSGYEQEIIDEIMHFDRQALCAYSIEFIHPVTNETLSFDIPLPDDFLNLLNLL